ncbi:hypothetical protein CANARDRAFT_198987 [[Candida] arabinofermentans NRRL YB-2248]|uniref:Uncharacterized protein n=1 Tax=[Candida] arabinofermentans NRRL YB-2248 TaxID=983967 RepID=A0A1E4T0W6_9ASCO|nr:hypothetical protein CANARDRAFT_198987 [[Candida] arabinofermentans NRRL YB-2248]
MANFTPASTIDNGFDPSYDPSFDPNAAAISAGLQAPQYSSNPVNSSSAIPVVNSYHQDPNVAAIPNQIQANNFQQAQTIPQQQFSPTDALDSRNSEDLSVAAIRYQMDYNYKDADFLTFENVSPPPAGTQYRCIDQGNASPKFARMSMYSIPSNDKLKQSTKLPLGMLIQPFAPTDEGEKEVPQVDFRSISTVPRCRRCRTYINPSMQHSVRNMVCNICTFSTPVPDDYVNQVDNNGVRADYYEKPELHSGVIDIIVPDDYNLDDKQPDPIHHVFLIDLSIAAIKSSLHEAACSAIRLALYNNGECNLPQGSKVSIVGFDDKIHFFNLSPDLDQTTMSTVGDLEDPFLPFYEGLFADPMESYSIIDTTLSTIEQNTYYPGTEPAYGTALTVAKLLLEQVGGGQVIATLSTLPSWGPGALKPKLQGQRPIVEHDREVLTPDSKFYQELLKEYNKANVGLNLFVCSNAPVDLANSGLVAHKTGGIVKAWYNFNIDRDETDLVYSIKTTVSDICGYQGQIKVRCSNGLQVNKYYGAFATSGSSTDPTLPNVAQHTSIACDFIYDGKLDTKKDAHFQAALLYTSKEGLRKVRVINCIMSVTERVSDVFSFADQDTVLSLMLRESLTRLPHTNLVAVRSYLNVQLANINAAYKALVGSNGTMPGQLVFPHGLRTLSMFILSALKSKGLKERVGNSDLRIESVYNLESFTATRLSAYLYPILISIHNLDESECIQNEKTGQFDLPKATPLTQTNLEMGGAYLIFNTKSLYLWLHSDVNPLLLQDLFGEHATSLDKLDSNLCQLPILDTHISNQVRNLCSFLGKHYLGAEFFPIQICRFRLDQNESEFIELLYEDKSTDLTWSYPEFLKHLHKQIGNKLNTESFPAKNSESKSSIFNYFS